MTKSILILSDTHFPYQHPQYFKWVKKIKDHIKFSSVIHIGDLVDFHSISFHSHSPELPNIKYEIDNAKKHILKLRKLFPMPMQILNGNHDIRIQRMAENANMPESFIKDLSDILGIEKSWKWTWHDKLIITLPNKNKVFFTHHFKSSVLSSSKELGMSFVAGHQHTQSNLSYWSSPTALNFAMTVGCSIDPKHEAFKYAKNFIKRPIISLGAIIDNQPMLFAMPMDSNGNWNGKVS